MKKINFWTYQEDYSANKNQILRAINTTLSKNEIFFGKTLLNFEKKFLKINKSRYGLSVKSGTDALMLSLICAGVKPGDEVITVSFTAIPTVSAIVSIGAIPKFVDIKDDLLIDEKKIEEKISRKTKAIIPVHLYGKTCNIDKIIKVAKKYKIKIIEDCAQSFLAKFEKINVGNYGDYGCYSFYPTKILGAYGDGGFIVCKKKNDLERLYKLRYYGIENFNKKKKFFNKYYSNIHGYNSRLDNVQASILNLKLKSIKKKIKLRLKLAKNYCLKLKIKKLFDPNHVYHLFVLKLNNRNKFIKFLNQNNIQVLIHYPTPLHKMKPYNKYVCKKCNCLKLTEKYSKKVVSLPIYPELKEKDQNKIISLIQKFNYIK